MHVSEEKRGEVKGSMEEYGWEFGTIDLRMVGALWAGITVYVTQEAGLVPLCTRAAIGTPSLIASYDTQGNGGRILSAAHRVNPPPSGKSVNQTNLTCHLVPQSPPTIFQTSNLKYITH